ncbi:MAG: hypothetical protein H0U86_04080 [Chloroflexi bacterium]|nr:hypothetical protein [Chloroflexota bacterium]
MLEPDYLVSADQLEKARAALLVEAMTAIHTRARRYLQEPGEGAWHDLVRALARAHGDSATYELLRAVEVHSRVSVPP